MCLLKVRNRTLTMHEQRSQKHHKERLAEAMREEIGAIVEGELGDPRIGLATISEVILMPGGKAARILVAVTGTAEEAADTIEGLDAAKGYVKAQLIQRLGLRHSPELFFVIDNSERFGGRVEELLARIKKRSGKR